MRKFYEDNREVTFGVGEVRGGIWYSKIYREGMTIMINVESEIQKLLKEIGPGRMSSTAYDTAWVARLGEVDQDLSNQAMEWLSENQLPDGSWGAKDIFYYHDRVIMHTWRP
jgi:halimadienyl-diphosphate synthase